MREYDLNVNGFGKVHVRQKTDDRFIVTIPAEPQARSQCNEKCAPWECPLQLPEWLRQRDVEAKELFNIEPPNRDLSGVLARLEAQCAQKHKRDEAIAEALHRLGQRGDSL